MIRAVPLARRPRRLVTLQILGLIVLHAAVTAGLVALSAADAGQFGATTQVVGLAALFALVGLMPMHLEFGRSACTFTLVEAVLVIALFTLGPLGVVLVATAGEAIACLTHRQRIMKAAYNAASTSVAAAVAALAFSAVGGPTAHGTSAYGCALLATAAFAVCNHASTSLVLATSGEGRFEDVFLVSASLAALAASVSGSTGLALKALSAQGWVAPLLLVPLIAVVAFETRRAAAHRAERLRFERLYSASARTTGLQGFGAALAQSAREARSLMTGSAAVCCARDSDGEWKGMIVDDSGASPAGARTVAAIVALVERESGRELLIESLPESLQAALPHGPTVVVAGTTGSAQLGDHGATAADAVPSSAGASTGVSTGSMGSAGSMASTGLRSAGGPGGGGGAGGASGRGGPGEVGEPSRTTQSGGIALAVFRDIGVDDQGEGRAKVLWAFVFHAALIATNALLFEQVEDALRHQVDLNRQKDEFLAAVSHELRTPLASMLGSVETLRRLEDRLGAEARERFFTIAQRQGKRLQRLIEELLLTAAVEHRQELVVAENVAVTELLNEVAEDLGGQARGRIVVRWSPDVPSVATDPHKLRQVLTNLVENATKYAPTGLIEVSAGAGALQRVEIRVADHGPGVAPQDRSRVFERFVQLDGSSTRTQGGTGLGLYLCAAVADLLEGELTLTETPGGGATFTLSLPIMHSSARLAPSEPVAPADRTGPPPFRRQTSTGPAAALAARPVLPADRFGVTVDRVGVAAEPSASPGHDRVHRDGAAGAGRAAARHGERS